MAVSQNGWPVRATSKGLVDFPWVTGRILGGDVYDVFAYLARRFNAEVEPIIKAHSWAYANRDVRGGSDKSNHASATATDFNAPAHPLGRRGTFSTAQVRKINEILGDLDGVMRWGGNYSSRADEMHFELIKDAAAVARVAAKLRGAGAAYQEDDDMAKFSDEQGARLMEAADRIMGVLPSRPSVTGEGVAPVLDQNDGNYIVGQIGALTEVVKSLALGEGADPKAIEAAAKKGAAEAIREAAKKVAG